MKVSICLQKHQCKTPEHIYPKIRCQIKHFISLQDILYAKDFFIKNLVIHEQLLK